MSSLLHNFLDFFCKTLFFFRIFEEKVKKNHIKWKIVSKNRKGLIPGGSRFFTM